MALLGHFKSSSGITLNGSNVSNWNSLVGSDHLEQLTAIDQPLYVPSAYNGHNVLRFDSTEFLECINSTAYNMGLNDCTIVLVMVKRTGDNPVQMVNKADGFGGASKRWDLLTITGLAFSYADGARRQHYRTNDPYVIDQHHVLIGRFNTTPNTVDITVDGVNKNDIPDNISSGMNAVDPIAAMRIGSDSSSADCDILEVKIYNSNEDMVVISDQLLSFYSAADDVVRSRRSLLTGLRR